MAVADGAHPEGLGPGFVRSWFDVSTVHIFLDWNDREVGINPKCSACASSTLRAVTTGTVDFSDLSRSSPCPQLLILGSALHVTDHCLGSVFKAALWTYIEPDAGIISACLPFLANVFGQRIAVLLKRLSSFNSRTTSTLKRRVGSVYSSKIAVTANSGTQRATYEEFDLDEDNQGPIPASMTQDAGADSIRNLV